MKLSEKRPTVTVRTDTVTEEKITYRYTLFYSLGLHEVNRSPMYSVRAERIDGEGNCQQEATECLLDPGYALIFYEICREHRVSPAHLHDVAQDFTR